MKRRQGFRAKLVTAMLLVVLAAAGSLLWGRLDAPWETSPLHRVDALEFCEVCGRLRYVNGWVLGRRQITGSAEEGETVYQTLCAEYVAGQCHHVWSRYGCATLIDAGFAGMGWMVEYRPRPTVLRQGSRLLNRIRCLRSQARIAAYLRSFQLSRMLEVL